LLGNLFPGTLPGTPLLANLFFGTFFATFSWKPVPGNLAWEPVPGSLAWQLYLEPLLGNLAWEPVLGNMAWESFLVTLLANLFLEKLIGNRVLGVAADPKLTYAVGEKRSQASFQEEAPKQVSRKRFPSKVRFLGTACKYGSQKRFPSRVPGTVSKQFQAGTKLAGTGSQASVPRKSWFPRKISRSKGSQGTLLENLFLATLLETLFLGTLLENLFLETFPGNFSREPYL